MMNPSVIIARKRDGQALSREEIAWFLRGYVTGDVADYQMAALAMAICLQGMNRAETVALTQEMLGSGAVLGWPDDIRPVVDKHSTGGIGDKVSLILTPLLACCDLAVPMLSGRGLGATGGTLDKLEAIPGFRTNLSREEIIATTRSVGCVITGTTADLVPADRQLYALRDVTATVESIPLITASILSKKLAESLDALVLDVKFGSGAFMKQPDEARRLAQLMVEVGCELGVPTAALLTDMNQPLGRMAGGAVEVDEAVEVLRGQGPDDLIEVTLRLGAQLLVLAAQADNHDAARAQLQDALDSGAGFEKFSQLVAAQGGDLMASRGRAPEQLVTAAQAGWVTAIDTEQLGLAIVSLGGGRRRKEDAVDPSVGLEMLVRLGQQVSAGEPLVRVFAGSNAKATVFRAIEQAVKIGGQAIEPPDLVREVIG